MSTAAEIPVIPGISALADRYDVILSDIWGVVHNGRQHFAEACAALRKFRDMGKTVILVTNAPRPFPPVLKQLEGLGVPDGTFDAVVTSGDVTLAFIAAHGSSPLYHIGPVRDHALFEILEQQTGLRPPLVPLESASYVVCTGLFDDDETPDDYASDLKTMHQRGLEFISANPDVVVHVGEREIYCSGALAQVYENMGGRVLQAGKPFVPIYDRAMELASRHLGRTPDLKRILAIGDGMHTDIGGAVARGLDAIFVTTGIHRAELHPAGELDRAALQKLMAAHEQKPIAAMTKLVW
jgi:HAD superfamily hydrolase (TIGR01459 family)